MQETYQAEDHQTTVQCYNECSGNVSPRKLYLKINGEEPSPESISSAVTWHGNNNSTDSHVKEEDTDMPTIPENELKVEIIIKDEIEIGEERHVKTNLSSGRVPVVYTTRLDDMQIFMKNFANLSVSDIVENIIVESKPKLTEPLKHQDECILTFDGHPFFNLVDKIKQFNKLSTSEDSEEEDMPLNVLTPKCGYLNVDRPVKTHVAVKEERQLLYECKPCTVPLVPSRKVSSVNGKSYVIYDSNNRVAMTFCRGVKYKIGIGCIIVFRNLITCVSEIFIIENNDGLFKKTSHKLENCGNFYKNKAHYGLNVDECCWYYRDYVIDSLICHKSISPNIPNIFRKPHPCPPGRCDCCCEKIFLEDDDVEEVPGAYQLIRSLTSNPDNLIIKALAYNRKDKLASANHTKTTADLTEINDCSVVQILKDYSDMIEFYELRSKYGNIVKHIEMKSKYLHMSNNFRKDVKLNVDSNKVYCCWRQRDAMLRSFEFKHKPMITQFIRTPHPCSPDHCICCCKPNLLKTSPKVPVVDLQSLIYAPKHGYNYTSINKQRRKFLAKPEKISTFELENLASKPQGNNKEIATDQHELSKKPVDSEVPGKDLPIFGNVNILQEMYPPKKLEEQTVHKKVLQKTAKPTDMLNKASVALQTQVPIQPEPFVLYQPGPSQLIQSTIAPVQSNIAFQQKNMHPTLANTPLQNDAQGSTVNSLVTSILHRFQDVRLIITPDGDVSAELNMPMNTLSTPELQLLSKILTHAKEQVKELKATGHFKSGTNTVLNPWPTNLQSNTNSTQAPGVHTVAGSNTTPVIIQNTPTAPVVIVNTNLTAQAKSIKPKPKKPSTSFKSTKIKENVLDDNSRLLAFQCYTNLSALKMKEYLTCCKSYLNDMKLSPKIADVFSLNEDEKEPIVQQIKKFKKSENTLDSNTSRVKRTRHDSPKSGTKKLKTVDENEIIEVDAINSGAEETPMATLMPIPPLVNVPRAPILSGMLNMPYVVPGTSIMNPNLMYVVPVPLPGSVAPIETPSDVKPVLNSDNIDHSPTNNDDCILGF